MALISVPWHVPPFHSGDSWSWPSSTATPPALERDSTATYYNNVAGPPVEMPPVPEPPRIGRPPRDRQKNKAARRARRVAR